MPATRVIDRSGLDALIDLVTGAGYTPVGPTVVDGAIVWCEIAGTADLPVGWTDRQTPGGYTLERRDDERLFGFVVGPGSLKRWFYPERNVIWRGVLENGSWRDVSPGPAPRYAFFGARACELAAVAIQDRVFMGEGQAVDRTYASIRRDALFIAVNCDEPGANCFCASMGTGPRATSGHDLALTELVVDSDPRYLVEVGSDRGKELIGALGDVEFPEAGVVAHADTVLARAAETMPRRMDTTDIHELLLGSREHPHWDDVASRCLTCANCTLVCPTCFCGSVTDSMTLDGREATRTRAWDSCFTLEFSYIHGGPVRTSASSRYRQWLTHKLASWIDQFGSSGCVGCGRCITWCPVGIDLTEEVEAIRREGREVVAR